MITITVEEDVAYSVLSNAKTFVNSVWQGYEKERQEELNKLDKFEKAIDNAKE